MKREEKKNKNGSMKNGRRDKNGEKIFVFFIFFEKNKSRLKHIKMYCLNVI
jgi:hypothetical protein